VAEASYHLTDEALIAVAADGVTVYGRWDRRFGCWRLTRNGLHPARPHRLLDRRGIGLMPWPHDHAAAVAAWFALIPLAVRRRAANAADQWDELERLWHVTGTGT